MKSYQTIFDQNSQDRGNLQTSKNVGNFYTTMKHKMKCKYIEGSSPGAPESTKSMEEKEEYAINKLRENFQSLQHKKKIVQTCQNDIENLLTDESINFIRDKVQSVDRRIAEKEALRDKKMKLIEDRKNAVKQVCNKMKMQ